MDNKTRLRKRLNELRQKRSEPTFVLPSLESDCQPQNGMGQATWPIAGQDGWRPIKSMVPNERDVAYVVSKLRAFHEKEGVPFDMERMAKTITQLDTQARQLCAEIVGSFSVQLAAALKSNDLRSARLAITTAIDKEGGITLFVRDFGLVALNNDATADTFESELLKLCKPLKAAYQRYFTSQLKQLVGGPEALEDESVLRQGTEQKPMPEEYLFPLLCV